MSIVAFIVIDENLDVMSSSVVAPHLSFNSFSLRASLNALEWIIGSESFVKSKEVDYS